MFAKTEQKFAKEATELLNDALKQQGIYLLHPEKLEQQRRSLGSMFFRQEYMCEFVETVDASFHYDIVQRAFSEAVQPLF